MGLYTIRARFEGPPPSEELFRSELLGELGSLEGLDEFEVDGSVVAVNTLLDAVTRPYAIKVLERLGGTHVDVRTLEPSDPHLPAFTSRRWLEWPWWKRAGIQIRHQLRLLATALPQQRIL